MVGSCDVKFPIRLEGLVLTHGQFSSYEPELFPGLIYRMVKPRIVLLIFVSGKVVLTGMCIELSYIYFEVIYLSLYLNLSLCFRCKSKARNLRSFRQHISYSQKFQETVTGSFITFCDYYLDFSRFFLTRRNPFSLVNDDLKT